jgi:hypothetical protein
MFEAGTALGPRMPWRLVPGSAQGARLLRHRRWVLLHWGVEVQVGGC